VDSESVSGESYLCDLAAHDRNGSCTCPNFELKLRPMLRAPGNKFVYRCKHIKWARDFVLDYLIKELDARDPNHKIES
jgi:hypothetical protein